MATLFYRLLKAKFYIIAFLVLVTAPFALGQISQESTVHISSVESDANMPKTAETGAWTWTDISEKIPHRTNRPVWDIAKTEDGWIFTDGLPFNDGGFVVLTDGSEETDITDELKEAGLGQVDDIVESFNQKNPLFAEGVFSLGNEYSLVQTIVEEDSSLYNNVSDVIRNGLGEQGIAWLGVSDAGLAIYTANGYPNIYSPIFGDDPVLPLTKIVTDFLKQVDIIEKLYPGSIISEADKQIIENVRSAVQDIQPNTPYEDQLVYSKRKTSPADNAEYLPLTSVWVDDGNWQLIAMRGAYASSTKQTSFFYYGTPHVFADHTDKIGLVTKLHAMASGGNQILIAGTDGDVETTNKVLLYDGENVVDLSEKAAELPFDTWNRAQITWNGESWLILSGKNLVRFDGENFEDLGRTRDLFLTVTGADGKFYLGGVVSQKDIDEPLFPLQAKLVMIEETVDEEEESEMMEESEEEMTEPGIMDELLEEPNMTEPESTEPQEPEEPDLPIEEPIEPNMTEPEELIEPGEPDLPEEPMEL
jgi:hypothetical protein